MQRWCRGAEEMVFVSEVMQRCRGGEEMRCCGAAVVVEESWWRGADVVHLRWC